MRGSPQFGPFFGAVGKDIDTATPQITSPIHHVITTASLTTLTPPVAALGFIGPVYLVASSVFSWTTSGNISTIRATTVNAGYAYPFIYNPTTGKWHPLGARDS